MKIENVQVNCLAEAIYRSGYPMVTEAPDKQTFDREVSNIRFEIAQNLIDTPHIKRAINLANAKGGGHDQFLSGALVSFDITLPNKLWVEAERYKYLVHVSSESTMHRIAKFDIGSCCNQYTNKQIIALCQQLQNEYNAIDESKYPEAKKEAYLKLLYNLPSGFEITAGMTTNYRCLKNVYQQRHNHPLPEWREICNEYIPQLPLAHELIMGNC